MAGAGVVLTIGASVTFFLWRKWQWREPLSVSYFVPQAVYAAQVFPGAPDTPEFPEHITVGVGTYCLIHHVAIKRPNVVVNGIQLEFHGPAKGRPRNRGITAPLLVRKFTNELEGIGRTGRLVTSAADLLEPIYLVSNSLAEQAGQKNANAGSGSSSGSSVRTPRQPLADRPLIDPH